MSLTVSKLKIVFFATMTILLGLVLVSCSGSEEGSTNESEMGLTNNPEIEDVRDAIISIEHISLIEIVTEENDPNGQLGKAGGYTGALFFIYDLVEDNNEDSAIDAGTDGGGCIEIYATVEDAESRDSYLGNFDGTIFSSGSHTVLGTVVIRTSNDLTASQQQTLEDAIIDALQNK